MKKTFALLTALVVPGSLAPAADLSPPVAAWLAAQTNLQSWSAEFVQTRALKSLTEPLTAQGRVWFAAPNRFRWELGQPPQTIAVRASEDLLVLYPRLKRVEKFPLAGGSAGPWKDALGLLEAGFPRSQAELESQYSVLSQATTNDTSRLVLQPKAAMARRMIPQIAIEFDAGKRSLLATELRFSDGSSLRNDFKNAVLNPPLDPRMFAPEIPSDYRVVEPLKKK